MKQQISTLIKDTVYYITHYFPFILCIAACFGYDLLIAFSFFIITVLFMSEINTKKFMPLLLSFLIIGYNPGYALGASLICGLLLIISSFFADKLKNLFSSPFISGIMISGALSATILFTTDYFGIGATGNNVSEMIKSYISLGFHPNWRGVLFGTIVLVIMITFPRKFKNLCKYVSASFIALFFTLILNLFLNPSDMVSSVNELSLSNYKDFFTSRIGFVFDLKTLFIGVALFIIYFYSVSFEKNVKQKDYIYCGITNIIFSGIIGIPVPYKIKNLLQKPFAKLLATAVVLLIILILKEYLLRIPLHSCAVVIIVTAWENVKWSEIKKQFSAALPFVCFAITVLISLVSNLTFGIIFSFILSFIYRNFQTSKNQI